MPNEPCDGYECITTERRRELEDEIARLREELASLRASSVPVEDYASLDAALTSYRKHLQWLMHTIRELEANNETARTRVAELEGALTRLLHCFSPDGGVLFTLDGTDEPRKSIEAAVALLPKKEEAPAHA